MTWKQHTFQISDKPAMVLGDDQFARQAPLRELPYLSRFRVYCNQPPGNSFWNPEETEMLDTLEDDLIKLCSVFGQGRVVYNLRIATAGVREYYLYHSEKTELNKAFLALKASHPNYRIEFDKMNDPDWKEYRKYVLSDSVSSP